MLRLIITRLDAISHKIEVLDILDNYDDPHVNAEGIIIDEIEKELKENNYYTSSIIDSCEYHIYERGYITGKTLKYIYNIIYHEVAKD